MHVLFVCTGNICRSPLAERLAVAYGKQTEITDFTASSAGTKAVVAHPIHQDAAHVLADLGGDETGFAARQLTPKVAADADLVLTMTRVHRDRVLELSPRLLRRTFTLTEAAALVSDLDAGNLAEMATLRSQLDGDDAPDIPDPLGQSPEYFAMVGRAIADALPAVLRVCRD